MGITFTNIIVESGSSVSTVTRLRVLQSRTCNPNIITGKEDFCSPKIPHHLWNKPGILFKG